MNSTLEDVCILCSSQESLSAQSHSTLRSLNLGSICNKYLSEELTGPFNKELMSSEKTWSAFCSTCFDNYQTLCKLSEELEIIKFKIKTHTTEMKQFITKNRIEALRANKNKSECVITIDDDDDPLNSEEVPIALTPGTNIISVEQGFLNPVSELNLDTSDNNDEKRKTAVLASILERHRLKIQQATLNMKPDEPKIKPAEPKQDLEKVQPIPDDNFQSAATSKPIVTTSATTHLNRVTSNKGGKNKCKKCGESFARSSELIIHKVDVHGKEKNYQCNICQQWFSTFRKLTKHTETNHSIFKCKFCGKIFHYFVNLEHHLKKHTINPKIVSVVSVVPSVAKTSEITNRPPKVYSNKRKSNPNEASSNTSELTNWNDEKEELLLGMDSCYQNEETDDILEIVIKPEIKIEEWPETMVETTENFS